MNGVRGPYRHYCRVTVSTRDETGFVTTLTPVHTPLHLALFLQTNDQTIISHVATHHVHDTNRSHTF